MEPLLAVSIKSEATQLNLAQIAMKSINLAGTKGVVEIKRRVGLMNFQRMKCS